MTTEAYIDGGSRGNPGPSGAGAYFPGLVSIAQYLGHQTNNFAEYSALIVAVRFAVERELDGLKVYSDSELVVKQIHGVYKVKNANIRPLYEEAIRWIAKIPKFSIVHVRRENNQDADRLANIAMDAKANTIEWESE